MGSMIVDTKEGFYHLVGLDEKLEVTSGAEQKQMHNWQELQFL